MQTVSVEQAIREVCGTGAKPILVYANDTALQTPRVGLSSALQTFVKQDNRLFKLERDQESPREKKRVALGDQEVPSKRFNRTNSVGSMDTNRASIGSGGSVGERDGQFDDDDLLDVASNTVMGDDMPHLVGSSTSAGTPAFGPRVQLNGAQQPDADMGYSLDGITDAAHPARPQHVELDDVMQEANGVPVQAKSPEMQERSGMPFVTRPGGVQRPHAPPQASSDEMRMATEGDD